MNDDDIITQIATLNTMTTDELKKLYTELFDSTAAYTKRNFLIQKLAYRLQEIAYGGIDEKTRMKIAEHIKTNRAISSDKNSRNRSNNNRRKTQLANGIQLIREYQGEKHHVTVVYNGYEYRGKTYRSLSRIAHEITGTNWSGPAFFGIKSTKK